MGRNRGRQRIASQINAAADTYRKKLVGKRFMHVFDDRFIEVLYKAETFKRLTGLESLLPAEPKNGAGTPIGDEMFRYYSV